MGGCLTYNRRRFERLSRFSSNCGLQRQIKCEGACAHDDEREAHDECKSHRAFRKGADIRFDEPVDGAERADYGGKLCVDAGKKHDGNNTVDSPEYFEKRSVAANTCGSTVSEDGSERDADQECSEGREEKEFGEEG